MKVWASGPEQVLVPIGEEGNDAGVTTFVGGFSLCVLDEICDAVESQELSVGIQAGVLWQFWTGSHR